MYTVEIKYGYDEDESEQLFFNEKESAIKCALTNYQEAFSDCIATSYDGNMKQYFEDICYTYEDYLKDLEMIKNGDFEDAWISICKIETKD